MTEQQHRTDTHCRGLLHGKSHDPLPEHIEDHSQGAAEMCGNCAECCLLINAAIKD